MEPKIVLFGDADFGKSTVVGFMYAKEYNINLLQEGAKLRNQLNMQYQDDYRQYLFMSLVNDDAVRSINLGEKGNSRDQEIRRIVLDYNGFPLNVTLTSTPGQIEHATGRELAIENCDIGIACISVEKALDDDFSRRTFEYIDLFHLHNPNSKLIYLVTKFDLCSYEEDFYLATCNQIAKYARKIVERDVDCTFGLEIDTETTKDDVASIIPIAIEFDKIGTKAIEEVGINIYAKSENTPWYNGQTFVQALDSAITAWEKVNER